jgi:hypothetical protein
MRYDGLENEVRLHGSVSIEDATAYLDYLMHYDFEESYQVAAKEMLRQIRSVQSHRAASGQTRFSTASNRDGCTTITFDSIVECADSLIFGKVDMITLMC